MAPFALGSSSVTNCFTSPFALRIIGARSCFASSLALGSHGVKGCPRHCSLFGALEFRMPASPLAVGKLFPSTSAHG
eukprot:2860677-Pyramimonas_sp.AAC.1